MGGGVTEHGVQQLFEKTRAPPLSISLDPCTAHCLPTHRPHLYFTTPPHDWLPATLIDAGGVVLPLSGSTTLFSLTHRNVTSRDQRRRNACNFYRERRRCRDRSVSPTVPIPPFARGFLPGRSSARSVASPSQSFSCRTTSPPPWRELPTPLVRTGGASSPLICEVEQRPTTTMLLRLAGGSAADNFLSSLFRLDVADDEKCEGLCDVWDLTENEEWRLKVEDECGVCNSGGIGEWTIIVNIRVMEARVLLADFGDRRRQG
ncbi:hypothetical protein DEO72_LG4g1238 [Vigna unguiculata]|uniref:Uncharacterized protein n=1 Tax=Vigna unguiculata TaxID=3917 RepID=A0A4D6LP98_VIGUN|nr:hypothetical protein DEO72_LG4g1238 [Vigna unguiculata]